MANRNQQAFSSTVGRNARQFRKTAQLCCDEVSRRSGINTVRLKALEGGKTAVDGAVLLKLAALYNVSLDAFFEGASVENQALEEKKVNIQAKQAIKGLMRNLIRTATEQNDVPVETRNAVKLD